MRAIEERCKDSVQVKTSFKSVHTEARIDCESIFRGGEAQLTFRDTFTRRQFKSEVNSSSLG